MVSSQSSNSASDEDIEPSDDPLLKHGVYFSVPQNARECASGHLKLPKFPGEAFPQSPPRLKGCRGSLGCRMFITSANKFSPLDKKRYVQPWSLLLSYFNDRMASYQSVYI